MNDEQSSGAPQVGPAQPTLEQQYEGFVNNLVTFLMERRGAHVLVLLETPDRGFENFRNTNSFAWCLGATQIARKMFKIMMSELRMKNRELIDQREREIADRIEQADKTEKGRTN